MHATVYLKCHKPVELAWRSSCVMDCHATAQGSIPGGNRVKTELHVFLQGTVNGDAVSKCPHCRRDAKHNQPATNLDVPVIFDLENS